MPPTPVKRPGVNKFLSLIFASRTQAHVFHLQTSSFAAHKALEDYYTGIIDLADLYAETYKGATGRKIVFTSSPITNDPKKALAYFMRIRSSIERMNIPKGGPLKNILDGIVELIDTTIYKLKFLK
jgi:hypothetical protein